MKRKILTTFLAGVMVLILCSCSGEKETDNKQEKQDTSITKQTEEPEATATPEVTSAPASIQETNSGNNTNFEEKIELDFVELTLNRALNGKDYIIFYGTAKNKSDKELKLSYSDVKVCLDDINTFDSYISGGPVPAGETEDIEIAVGVPEEIMKKYSKCHMNLSFNNNFEQIQVDKEPQNTYDIILDRAEIGEAEIKEITWNEDIVTDFMEIKFDKEIKAAQRVDAGLSVEAEEGCKMLYMEGTLTNRSDIMYEFDERKAQAVVDGTEYNGHVYTETLEEISPNSTVKIYFMAAVPDTVAKHYESFTFSLEFSDNFAPGQMSTKLYDYTIQAK